MSVARKRSFDINRADSRGNFSGRPAVSGEGRGARAKQQIPTFLWPVSKMGTGTASYGASPLF